MNTIDGASAMGELDCLSVTNLKASQYGLTSRLGYQLWTTGAGAGTIDTRSVFPFNGSDSTGTQDKLFSATKNGIYDSTSSSAAPTQVATYGTTTTLAGYGTCVAFNTSANRYLVATDEINGLWVYTQSTGLWAQITMGGGATQISGVDPTTFCHVTVFKNRLWFTQKSTTLAWYMGTNALFGPATSFDFGAKFAHGGDLRGLFNWSYDGGNGIDALLVGISGGGDVVIYQGTDPSTAASFSAKGTWYVGGVPAGRRLATEHGGDLLVLGSIGVIPLSRLVVGGSASDLQQYSTYKISSAFGDLMRQWRTYDGWALWVHPTDNVLLVNVPVHAQSNYPRQLAMSLVNRSWSQYGDVVGAAAYLEGLPAYSAAAWNGEFYLGLLNPGISGGAVAKATGTKDVVLRDGTGGNSVNIALTTGFSDFGGPGTKQISQTRPRFLTQNYTATYPNGGFPLNINARYNYNLTSVSQPTTATASQLSALQEFAPIVGATGLGHTAAISLWGVIDYKTVLVGIDVLYQEGGFQ